MKPIPIFCPNCGDTRNLKATFVVDLEEKEYTCLSCVYHIGMESYFKEDIGGLKMIHAEMVNFDAIGGFKPMVVRSSKWPALRKRHLKKHPKCVACGRTDYLEVHHVVPVHFNPKYELELDMLLTLCEAPSHNDHLLFGHFLNWKCWNTRAKVDATNYSIGLADRSCK